jgi:hypothetical protein
MHRHPSPRRRYPPPCEPWWPRNGVRPALPRPFGRASMFTIALAWAWDAGTPITDDAGSCVVLVTDQPAAHGLWSLRNNSGWILRRKGVGLAVSGGTGVGTPPHSAITPRGCSISGVFTHPAGWALRDTRAGIPPAAATQHLSPRPGDTDTHGGVMGERRRARQTGAANHTRPYTRGRSGADQGVRCRC